MPLLAKIEIDTELDTMDRNFTSSFDDSGVDSLPRYVLLSMALSIGIPGIFFNALIAYIKTRYSKRYKSPTYVFMVQLALADIIVLVCVSIGTAVFILFPRLPNQCPILHDFFAFTLNFGWHPGCCFLCCIVYSRYITLCGNDKLEDYFSQAKIRIYIICSWLVMGRCITKKIEMQIFSTLDFLFNNRDGILEKNQCVILWSPEILSWGNDIETGLLGKLLLILTMSQSYFSFVFIGFYNLRILFWLRKVRHSVTMVDNSRLCKQE
uniref:G-protein coupled receptors family 1 profile domain-containing protein n=1 Tax=Romanomermis culicivorax TaxID=13658 RepID=A0A915JPE1_ROMCU